MKPSEPATPGESKSAASKPRPSHAVVVGEQIHIATPTRLLDIEVLGIPERPPARRDRRRFYRILREEYLDPYEDLSF